MQRLQCFLPGSPTTSLWNGIRPSIDFLSPKPASVRALVPMPSSSADLSYPIFAVFDLPDELILYIFSHISPRPWFTSNGYHARFRVQRGMTISNFKDHREWVQSLLPLSMTCTAMRLRLLPWMWERLECLAQDPRQNSERLNPTARRKSERLNPTSSQNSRRPGPTTSRSLEWALLGKVHATTEALHADTCLATSVRYFYALLCPPTGLIHVSEGS